jgi:hypothetical protein
MESRYSIHLLPESFLEPNPIGYVLAGSISTAHQRAACVLKIGLHIAVGLPLWGSADQVRLLAEGR